MGSTTEPRLRRDASENRRRLLAAAEQVFAERGITAPVEEIARVAGVGMGTLYRRFPTKQALIEALVEGLRDEYVAAGAAALDGGDADALEAFVWRMCEMHAARRGCMLRLWRGVADEEFVASLDAIVAELLVRAQAAGRVREDCTVTDVTAIWWGVRGILEIVGGQAPGIWRRHVELTLAGMRPGEQPLRHPPLSDCETRQVSRLRLTGPHR